MSPQDSNLQSPRGAPEGYSFRRPALEDAQATLELMLRRDLALFGEHDSDLEDILYDWNHIDTARDAWLACAPDGRIVGYAAVLGFGESIRYDFCVDPAQANGVLFRALLALCEERGPACAAERGLAVDALAKTHPVHTEQQEIAVLEEAGYRPERYIYHMRLDMVGAVPAPPRWPDGVELRTFIPGQDDRPVHELIQAAFRLPGRVAQSFEEWREFMMAPDLFRPDLWFLAMAGGELVGACLCVPYSMIGWVRQLGVAERWQRKGIGTALLRHAFAEFRARGWSKAGLTVESRRPGAQALYLEVGMQQARQLDEYVKRLNQGPREATP